MARITSEPRARTVSGSIAFTVPAVHLGTIKQHRTEGALPVIAAPQDGDAQTASGALTFVDNAVDMTTDTIKLKATFPNTDRRLWPGQFARVTLRLAMLPHAIVVPSQAVQTGQDGQYVFVVKPDSTVEQRPIVQAQRVDQDIVVDKGLKAGEVVVTEGQLRLEGGTRVTTDQSGGQGGGLPALSVYDQASALGGATNPLSLAHQSRSGQQDHRHRARERCQRGSGMGR